MKINIDRLDEQELIALAQRIADRLHAIRRARDSMNLLAFAPGDRVSFESSGQRHSGVVIRTNQRTVSVLADSGTRWTVSPHLLEHDGVVRAPCEPATLPHPQLKFPQHDGRSLSGLPPKRRPTS